MSQTGKNIGGMVDPAMGAGGPAVPSEEDILIEVEGQAPGLVDETLPPSHELRYAHEEAGAQISDSGVPMLSVCSGHAVRGGAQRST